MDEESKKVTGYKLECERGHEDAVAARRDHQRQDLPERLRPPALQRTPRQRHTQYRRVPEAEAELSLLAAGLTRDEVVHEGKELPDIVVIRADTACRFGAVNYIITKCQEQGYRKFALKTMHGEELRSPYKSQPEAIMSKRRSDEDVTLNVTAMLDMAFQLLAFFILTFRPPPGEDQIYLKLPPAQPVAGMSGTQKAGAGRNQGCQGRQTDQVADGEP